MADKLFIKKIKLSDGQVYYLCDDEAAKKADLSNYLPLTGGELSGNLEVDAEIATKKLQISEIQVIDSVPDYFLVEGIDGEVQKRHKDNILGDIGGVSFAVNEGTLSLKVGK